MYHTQQFNRGGLVKRSLLCICMWIILCGRSHARNSDLLPLIVENEKSEQCTAVFIEKVHLENAKITEKINAFKAVCLPLLAAHVERGINSFFIGELDNAIEDFSYVLSLANPNNEEDWQLLGTALWGRMFCYAFADSVEQTYEDIELIRRFFIERAAHTPCGKNKMPKGSNPSQHVEYRLAQNRYEDGHRRLTPRECNERVSGTANLARTIALKIKNSNINGIVNFVIGQIENFGYQCCQDAPDWKRCLDPIVNVWNHLRIDFNKLQELYDQGVPLSSFLQAP